MVKNEEHVQKRKTNLNSKSARLIIGSGKNNLPKTVV